VLQMTWESGISTFQTPRSSSFLSERTFYLFLWGQQHSES
jgi:hypothetical protein